MSIIVLDPCSPITTASVSEDDRPAIDLRELLDHIAVELAHEYIRLMETAADAEFNDE